ncbi:hypothetical protein [Enterococcus faecalis]|uniref:hypothetical protein n=1 Tax=Enterococcus faecalis TaxID=1351 RepID=UPI00163BF195|nr:hypothetical protein [Enterococcus faecalis]MDH5031345.1 hypothetical protein [Enterococcus faecalis]HAP2890228.1 hypothetical protein [Enterococcus faecalis]HAP2890505.1 hypothetical protein [Enterococcus faecalis]HAP4022958.1 hypothetical protein [Enterococcus faecalis]HAP4113564.1 hypothetical protein [Enterococcus faecalis]
MRELNWNEVQTLRGLLFKELDRTLDKYTKADLLSCLEKIDERRIELQIQMQSSED